jgi:hypothetical protein
LRVDRAPTGLVIALLCASNKGRADCTTLLGNVVVVYILSTGDSCDGAEESELLEEHIGIVCWVG